MGLRQHEEEEEQAEVSMSPLIDCVFLLLIFFLVSTILKKDDFDIDIDLPESESAIEILPTDEQIVIGIDADENLFYDGHESTLMEVHAELRRQALEDPAMRIRLDADADTPVHRIIEILDLCQFNDLGNVWIRTWDKHYNRR